MMAPQNSASPALPLCKLEIASFNAASHGHPTAQVDNELYNSRSYWVGCSCSSRGRPPPKLFMSSKGWFGKPHDRCIRGGSLITDALWLACSSCSLAGHTATMLTGSVGGKHLQHAYCSDLCHIQSFGPRLVPPGVMNLLPASQASHTVLRRCLLWRS